jgi:hypothetical protein
MFQITLGYYDSTYGLEDTSETFTQGFFVIETDTHDFNGDGKSDIAWRNTNGDVAIWLMNGTQTLSAPDIGNVPTSWSMVGQRQLNNSGYADLIWRNTNGDVAIWLMNGTQLLSGPDIGNVPTSWTIVGTGDFRNVGLAVAVEVTGSDDRPALAQC